MVVGQDTLYGNEWIDYNKTYWKIKVAKEDMYRVTYDVLQAGGFPVEQVTGDQFQLFVYGKEVPLYVSTDGLFGPNDYFEFYGDKNKSQLDQFLYEGGRDAMLNPEVSLYTDTAVYFLTTTSQNALRYKTIDPPAIPIIPPLHTYIDSSRLDFISWHYSKTYDSDQLVRYSIYDEHEGFASPSLKKSIYNQATPDIILDSAGLIQIKLISSSAPHHLQITINNNLVFDSLNYPSNQVEQLDIHLPAGILEQINTIQIEGLESNSDRFQIASSTIQYHRTLPFNNTGSMFIHAEPSNSGTLYSWKSSDPYTLFNHTLHTRTELSASNDSIRFALNPSLIETRLSLCNQFANPNAILSIQCMNFIDYSALPGNYIIISHPKLLKSSTGENPLEAYKNYRESADGGNFQVQIMMIDQLIDQYAWGNSHHPLAVRNWVAEANEMNSSGLNCLLIGKAIDYSYLRLYPEYDYLSYLPTFGTPGSDNLLFSAPNKSTSLLSIGRIPATSTEEINQYLDKLIAYENTRKLPRSIENYIWRHKAIHLNGGYEQNEIDLFKTLLQDMALIIDQGNLGITTYHLTSNSKDAVSTSNLAELFKLLNEGAILKTYLGHGSPTATSSFSIDDPSLLEENRFLPLAFSLGCYTGNSFTSNRSLSEKFVLEGKKGCIGYIASSGLGYPNALHLMASEFYKLQSSSCNTCSVGQISNLVREKFEDNPNFPLKSLRDQLNYYGDPAITLGIDTLPDFIIDINAIKSTPASPKSNSDSVIVEIPVYNIGKSTALPLIIESKIVSPDNFTTLKQDTIYTNSHMSLLTIKIMSDGKLSPGEYKIFIQLDPNNKINEGTTGGENNNSISLANNINYFSLLILNNTPSSVYPNNYAIVNKKGLFLTGYSAQDGKDRKYTIELDTTPYFNSSTFSQKEITTQSSLFSWEPALKSNQVYFWRIIHSPEKEGLLPSVSSTYSFITTEELISGWNQSTFYQFTDNHFNGLHPDSLSRIINNSKLPINIKAHALASDPIINIYRSTVAIDDKQAVFYSKNPSLSVFVISNLDAKPLISKSFLMSGSNNQRKDAIEFIRDSLPIGETCIILSYHNKGQSYETQNWTADSLAYGDNISSALEAYGSTLIRTFQNQDGAPFAFAFQPGKGKIQEALADANDNNAFITFDLLIPGVTGYMTSPLIGPFNQWDSLQFEILPTNDQINDQIHVDLLGFKYFQSQPLLLKSKALNNESLKDSIYNNIPWLQLIFNSKDSVDRTAAQLVKWRVFAKPGSDLLPEFRFQGKTIFEPGEPVRVDSRVYNFGTEILDSISIDLKILNPHNESYLLTTYSIGIPKDSFLNLSYNLPITLDPGIYQVILEIDKMNKIPEFHENNNTTYFIYEILEDIQAPLLDVRFDGKIISNQEVVAVNPTISITLWDNNSFLPLYDTSLLSISLYSPSGNNLPFYYINNRIKFTQVNPHSIQAILNPLLSEEGYYTLVIQAKDASGKALSNPFYSVKFRSVNQSHLIALNPLPNPANNSVRFAISFEGPSSPTRFQMQIFSENGTQVISVSEKEFGKIQIGNSISEFTWDCTDNNGIPVPSGIYFFQAQLLDENNNPIPYTGKGLNYKNNHVTGSIVVLRQ